MTADLTESVWLNTSDICSFEHIVQVSGLTQEDLHDLIDTGIIQPSNDDRKNQFFHTNCIVIARRARRLQIDFELDSHGVALALNLLQRIEKLEAQLASLRSPLAKPKS